MEAIHYSKQKGFTLVEIAIVMVIIGLLLGAVLKGQNLINSARVRSMADQNSSVQAAYYGFIDRYRAVPGDMPPNAACAAIGANNLAGCSGGTGTVGGDGNGNLSLSGGSTPEDFGEASALWAHLSAANFIVGSYEGGASGDATYVAKVVAPVNAFGGRVILWRTNQYLPTTSATTRLGFVVGRSAPASVLAELDGKVDYGHPESGVLRATTTGTGTIANGQDSNCITTGTGGEGTTASPNAWNVTGDSQDCNAIYLY